VAYVEIQLYRIVQMSLLAGLPRMDFLAWVER